MFVESTFQVPYVAACLAITSASRSVSYYLSLVAWLRLLYIDAYACSHSGCVLYLQHTSLSLGTCNDGAARSRRTPTGLSSDSTLSGATVRRRSDDSVHRACQPLAARHVRHLSLR